MKETRNMINSPENIGYKSLFLWKISDIYKGNRHIDEKTIIKRKKSATRPILMSRFWGNVL